MKESIYLIFYNKVKSEKLVVFLTKLAYGLLSVRYFILKWISGKEIVPENCEQSGEIVSAIEKKPVSEFEIVNARRDESVDLSVIVPVYNYENVLEEMIESVLNQNTCYRYEVILVDDGSREPAKEILRKYEHMDRVKVIYQENRGISGARNTGLNAACGAYIMFVDCDDVVHPDIVEKLMGEAEQTGADIVIGGHALVKYQDGKEISRRNDVYPSWNLGGYQDDERIMNYPGLPWGKVYKRELFEKVRFPVNYWYEDTIIHFLLFRLAKSYAYVPEVLYDYRWYEGNYSKVQSKSVTRVVEHYWIVEYMLEEGTRIGIKWDEKAYKVLLRHLGGYLYHAVAALTDEQKRAIFDLACKLAENHRVPVRGGMNLQLRELEVSLLERDYTRWILASTKL